MHAPARQVSDRAQSPGRTQLPPLLVLLLVVLFVLLLVTAGPPPSARSSIPEKATQPDKRVKITIMLNT